MARVKNNNLTTKRKRWLWATLYTLYIVFILILAVAYYAENTLNTRAIEDYNSTLTFDKDGQKEHYIVKLTDTSESGMIQVDYNANPHHLDVITKNIQELIIDCKSIAEEKSEEILNVDFYEDENYYKQYFIEKEKFIITVTTDHTIDLTIKDIPYPSKIILNENILREGTDYSFSDGTIQTIVNEGNSRVTIYFGETTDTKLNAKFKTDKNGFYHIPNQIIYFDASESTGEIEDYIWDFGDGDFGNGILAEHNYIEEGNYKVTLVIRDSTGLIKRASNIIHVFDNDADELADGWENKYNVQKAYSDDDNDDLINLDEYIYNTDPNNPDTDFDGYSDKDELTAGTDPLDSTSTPTEKEEKEKPDLNWSLLAGGVAAAVITIMIVFYFIYIQKTKTKESDSKKIVTKKPGELDKARMVIKKTKKKRKRHPVVTRRAVGYVASTTPIEVLKPKHPQQPHEPPKRPIVPEPRLPRTRPSGLQDRMIGMLDDDEMRLPSGSKIVYECPTCDSPVAKDEEICQVCGQQFED